MTQRKDWPVCPGYRLPVGKRTGLWKGSPLGTCALCGREFVVTVGGRPYPHRAGTKPPIPEAMAAKAGPIAALESPHANGEWWLVEVDEYAREGDWVYATGMRRDRAEALAEAANGSHRLVGTAGDALGVLESMLGRCHPECECILHDLRLALGIEDPDKPDPGCALGAVPGEHQRQHVARAAAGGPSCDELAQYARDSATVIEGEQ